MARSMVSLGMLAERALSTASRKRALESGSPPPIRAAVAISRIVVGKTVARLWSCPPFLRLMVAHFEWPDMEPLGNASQLARAPDRAKPPSGSPSNGLEKPPASLSLGPDLPIPEPRGRGV